MTSRRDFLIGSGLGMGAALIAAKDGSSASKYLHPFDGPFGLELWSLRNQIKQGDPSTVRSSLTYAKHVGYTEIEVPSLEGLSASQLRKLLDEVGLPCTSMIATYDQYRTGLNKVIQDAHTLGASNVINGWIPHARPLNLDLCLQTATQYNKWGRDLRAEGLSFGHHTHGEEFQPYKGRPLFNTLIAETNPDYVDFEMDIFWVVDAGQDPVAYLRQYPTRFRLMHLKDMRKGPPLANYTANAPGEWDVPLGTGRIDLPAILSEATRIGVSRYYVEDESKEAVHNIVETLHYLKSLRLCNKL
jgi:sugar phosphate isomerase/epimerase